jgi:hypothetical protein
MIFQKRYPDRSFPSEKRVCLCGKSITENCYIGRNGNIQIVGNCCLSIFMTNECSRKRCIRCKSFHSNRTDNWCNDCRGGVLKIGKYKGKSYRLVWKEDTDYCNWVQSVEVPDSLVDFSRWLSLHHQPDMAIKILRKRKRGSIDHGSNIIRCGKYFGESFASVWVNHKSYCRWVKRKSNLNGPLRDFQIWLHEST